ncbi:Apoptosis-inducing factor 2, partial [Globomyces sp. JEL0801]
EIKETYPQKEVTIVSNGLLSRTDIDPSYIKKLRGKLERLGIVLLLGERIIKPKDFQTDELLVHQHLKTKSGLEIYADLVLDSTGSIKPNTGFVEEFDPTSITESGYIQVTNTLQLEAYKNIFSLGDVANTGAPKMAAVLDPQVSTVTSNIYAMIHQKGLTEYVTPVNDTMFLSVGKKDAFGCFKGYNNIVLDYAGIYLKSGDLFLGQLKPLYGLGENFNLEQMAHRRVDVDEIIGDEDQYEDDVVQYSVADLENISNVKTQDVRNYLQRGDFVNALARALDQPCYGGAEVEPLKNIAMQNIFQVLSSIRPTDIPQIVGLLNSQQIDTLVKYIYKGLASPAVFNSNILLSWHEKVTL